MRKLVYFIACTVDGFIAREDGSFDFFPMAGEHLPYLMSEYPETIPHHVREALGVRGSNKHFGAVVMGRRTYEVGSVVGVMNPYPQLQQYVISNALVSSPDPAIQLVSHGPTALVRRLKQEDGLDIWLCGGASLAGTLYDEIDELILKVNPVVLGSGIPLFRNVKCAGRLELTDHRVFAGGVAIHRYLVLR